MTVTAAPVEPGRSVRIAGRRYAVNLPQIRDPRLHVAAVIVSVQVLGQVALGFDVSIAQILVAVLTAAVLEVTIVAAMRQEISWPASAMLTGNGVALILRSPHTVHGDWWSLEGWPVFMSASAAGLLSKYAIRAGGRHVFNPSNLGLVLVFLILGPRFADPQDLWWGPWGPALAFTVALILVGGITLSMRLHLFSVAITFWVTFAVGIGILAASGHAITARWHVGPVTDWSYWWVFVTSPEIVIFVFFMITDPRTSPVGRVARPVYAALVGVIAAMLASFQHTEYATKVSLLAALVLVCAVRPLLDRWLPDSRFEGEGSWWWRRGGATGSHLQPTWSAVGLLAVASVLWAGVIVGGGSGVRTGHGGPSPQVEAAVAGKRPRVHLPPGSVPDAPVDQAVTDLPGALGQGDGPVVARDVVEDLAIDADAIRAGDLELATTAAFGDHLVDVGNQIDAAKGKRTVVVTTYEIDQAKVVLLRDPVNPQPVPNIGLLARGHATDLTIATGTKRIVHQEQRPVSALFLVNKVAGHWLVTRVLPIDSPMVIGGAKLPD